MQLLQIKMSSLGEPKRLRDDILPTELDIYHHFIVLRNEKIASGEWSKFTTMAVRLKAVMVDVCRLWNRTAIPHCFTSTLGERKLANIISKCKTLSKVPMVRREKDHAQGLQSLFDAACCSHRDAISCTCPEEDKV